MYVETHPGSRDVVVGTVKWLASTTCRLEFVSLLPEPVNFIYIFENSSVSNKKLNQIGKGKAKHNRQIRKAKVIANKIEKME